MNLDNLIGIGDVERFSVSLPAIGDDLNEDGANGRIRNVSDAVAIGFDVESDFFILSQLAFHIELNVDAGIFDRLVFLTARDLNGKASVSWIGGLRPWGGSRGRRRRILGKRSGRTEGEECSEKSNGKDKGANPPDHDVPS